MASTSDSFSEVPAERRREILSLQVIDSVLGVHLASKLREEGFRTIGDLAVATETELLQIKGFGKGALFKVYGILDSFGFSLRAETEEPLRYLIQLYGDSAEIPGKLMYRWVSGLDEASFEYLRLKGTLGELARGGRIPYLTWRGSKYPSRERFASEQAEMMSRGLAFASLHFLGE